MIMGTFKIIIKAIIKFFSQTVPVLPLVLYLLPKNRAVTIANDSRFLTSAIKSVVCWSVRFSRNKNQVIRKVKYNVENTTFLMDLNVNDYSQCLCYFAMPNPDLVRLLQRGGSTMLDVGANAGVFGLLASQYFDQVLAFEPCAETAEQLHRNIELSKATNIEVFQYALSDRQEAGKLYVNPLNKGGNKLEPFSSAMMSASGKSGWISQEVEVRTLDSILTDAPPLKIDLIKIDVEGFEAHVIRGAQRTIERHRPVLFVEIATQEAFDQIYQILPESYRAWNPVTGEQTNSWVSPDTLFSEFDPMIQR